MFTGLIEDVGTVRELSRGAGRVRLTVATTIPMAELVMGESIAVNGICLTVVAFGGGTFSADASPETMARSSLGELRVGSPVNLERALRLGDRLGGHIVSGHVDAVATIVARKKEGNAVILSFEVPQGTSRYLVEKGSVAVDGISLTVNAVSANTFSLSIIPHTLKETTLHDKEVGARVNIEVDVIGKYVERLLKPAVDQGEAGTGGVDLDFLAKHGFL